LTGSPDDGDLSKKRQQNLFRRVKALGIEARSACVVIVKKLIIWSFI
jgi:hypothetical protein